MLIRCPICSCGFDAPLDVLDSETRILRCTQCHETWALPGRLDTPEIVAEAQSGRHAPAPPAIRAPRRALPGQALRRMLVGIGGPLLVLGGISAGMAALAFKDAVARLLPPSAAVFAAIGLPVHRQGLGLAGIRSTVGPDPSGSGQVLTLEGRISNMRRAANPIPHLRVTIRDKSRNALYSWLVPPPQPRLAPEEAVMFRSRLAAPPSDGQDIVVSFADGADEGAGSTENR